MKDIVKVFLDERANGTRELRAIELQGFVSFEIKREGGMSREENTITLNEKQTRGLIKELKSIVRRLNKK